LKYIIQSNIINIFIYLIENVFIIDILLSVTIEMIENDRYYDPDSMSSPFGCMGNTKSIEEGLQPENFGLGNQKGSE